MSPDDSKRPPRAFWRRAGPGWLLAVACLAAGLPLFLRMPPWCDLTLYDLAVRAVRGGGVHYRDVFDTNLPGFVWCLSLVRATFGPSVEAVRCVDLAIVLASAVLLARFARRAGADRAGIAWFAAGVALFYPFTTEFCHAQRDVWMLLPALLALAVRLRETPKHAFAFGVLEGALWGIAVWFKPHVLFPAVGVWLATGRRGFLPNLLGGTAVGAVGIAWLVRSGTWPYFAEVFGKWNPHYTEYLFAEIGWRAISHWFHFAPWTFLQPLVVLLAIADLARHRRWTQRLPRWLYIPPANESAGRVRAALGALYLAWLLQSFLLQRQFPYVHVPGTLIAFALFAAHRWAVVPFGLAYLACSTGLFLACERWPALGDRLKPVERAFPWLWLTVPKHPLADAPRWREWRGCWDALDGPDSLRRMDRLGSYPGYFPSIAFVEAREIAEWLKARGATAADVIAWHSSPHAVYLDLPGTPGFRFLHVDTPLIRRATYEYLKEELVRDAVPRARYVVGDLCRTFVAAPPERADDWMRESVELPPIAYTAFPYNQPEVYRSDRGRGRYVVYELRHPVTVTEYDLPGGNIWGRE
jgi:hypothetical protein